MSRFFNVYSYCRLVQGNKRAVICDLQRNIIQPIPLVVYKFIEKANAKDIQQLLKEEVESDFRQLVEDYISFLYLKEFGFYSDKPIERIFNDELEEFIDGGFINNAIIDFSLNSQHSLEHIVLQLAELNCKAIQLRFFYSIDIDLLKKYLEFISRSSLEQIECCLEMGKDYELKEVVPLVKTYPKLVKLIISNADRNVIYEANDCMIIYTTEIIRSENKCGVTGDRYFIAEERLFKESKRFNNCLYKKVGIDKYGYIKNCPSMKISYGHIAEVPIKQIVTTESFQHYGRISKDQIETCSE
jgi:SPASM domain peptide maturase of grasp-with-spasm system